MNYLQTKWNWTWKFWWWRLGINKASWPTTGRPLMIAFCLGPLEYQITSPQEP